MVAAAAAPDTMAAVPESASARGGRRETAAVPLRLPDHRAGGRRAAGRARRRRAAGARRRAEPGAADELPAGPARATWSTCAVSRACDSIRTDGDVLVDRRDGPPVGRRAERRRCGSAPRCWPRPSATSAHPPIRNSGTVGGSIAHADPAAELPAVALALDAEMVAVGPQGERRIPAAEFFQRARSPPRWSPTRSSPRSASRAAPAGTPSSSSPAPTATSRWSGSPRSSSWTAARCPRGASPLSGVGPTPVRPTAAEQALAGRGPGRRRDRRRRGGGRRRAVPGRRPARQPRDPHRHRAQLPAPRHRAGAAPAPRTGGDPRDDGPARDHADRERPP